MFAEYSFPRTNILSLAAVLEFVLVVEDSGDVELLCLDGVEFDNLIRGTPWIPTCGTKLIFWVGANERISSTGAGGSVPNQGNIDSASPPLNLLSIGPDPLTIKESEYRLRAENVAWVVRTFP